MRWQVSFDQLRVGERFCSTGRVVRDTDVLSFSALTGDWHPQHCDAEWAAGSPFGERIAHGMLVLSLALGLVPFDHERVVALRKVSDVVFKRPVRLEERIAVAGEVTALRPVDDGTGVVELKWTIHNQRGETVCRATVQVLWRRDPTSLAPSDARPVFWHECAGTGEDGAFMPVPL